MVITESIILAAITVVFGGIISIILKNVEGKHATRIEEIKAQAASLEYRLMTESEDKDQLVEENRELEKEILDLESQIVNLVKDVDKWRTRSHRIEQEMHELRLIFLRIMQTLDIPTDQFEALITQINKKFKEES